ncbi:MFS transporter [Chloroflexota bacterium]
MTVTKLGTFSAAFKYRNFRYFWVATMFASSGRWMEAIVLSWLVLKMTGSPFLTGLVIACRWLGYGLGPVFGAWTDRYDRRTLLLIITSLSVVYSFILAFLITTGSIQYWQTIIIALVASLAHGFDFPLRYAFTTDMVDKQDLSNAVALSAVAIDITAILGPALAGPLIDIIGTGGVCWILVGNYILNVLALYIIRGVSQTEKMTEGSLWSNIVEGARYIRSNPPVFALLIMAATYNLFEFPLRNALVPVFADKILDVGASGYGFLLASSGAGALIGAAVVAMLGDFRYKAWLCIISSVGVGIAAAAFSNSTLYPLSLPLMSCVGVLEAIGMITLTALLLLLTPTEMKGRVMGMRSFAILPLSIGSIIAGAMAENFGAPIAGTINASLQFFLMLIISLMVPSLRRSG